MQVRLSINSCNKGMRHNSAFMYVACISANVRELARWLILRFLCWLTVTLPGLGISRPQLFYASCDDDFMISFVSIYWKNIGTSYLYFVGYFVCSPDRSQDWRRWRGSTEPERLWIRRPEEAFRRCWWVFSHA